jgi:hypothetical protein
VTMVQNSELEQRNKQWIGFGRFLNVQEQSSDEEVGDSLDGGRDDWQGHKSGERKPLASNGSVEREQKQKASSQSSFGSQMHFRST